MDNLALADRLGLPLLGCAPDIGQLYSSRTGAKRVFTQVTDVCEFKDRSGYCMSSY